VETHGKAPSYPLFARECRFVAGVATIDAMPDETVIAPIPEVAFCGRSNVGKSSLVNALLGRTHLVRTSSTPGHTRQLNFFNLAETLMLVDVPGYGYAKAPKHEIARWTQVLFTYLRGRARLMRVCLLIDVRQGVKASDEEMMTLLDEAAVSYQLVLTKTDKLSPAECARVAETAAVVAEKHPAAHPHVLLTSSETGHGLESLQESLMLALEASGARA
jgi:GTP-binding protein